MCKHRVHASCAVSVPYCIEVVCKQCIPKSPPALQVGRPWLMHADAVMRCLACRAYPQLGMQKPWQTGTSALHRRVGFENSKPGPHAVALAFWQSNDTTSTVIGLLPEQVCNAICGLFMLVYCIVKRMAPLEHLSGDAEVTTMTHCGPIFGSKTALFQGILGFSMGQNASPRAQSKVKKHLFEHPKWCGITFGNTAF